MTANSNSERDARLLTLFVLLLAIFTVVDDQITGWQIWGLSTWQVYPHWLDIALCLFTISVGAIALRNSPSTIRVPSIGLPASSLIWWVISISVLFLFFVLRSNNFLLGDGLSIIDRTAQGVDIAPFSWPNVWLHKLIFALLPGEATERSILTYRITSLASGLLIIVALTILTRNLSTRLLALALFLSFGIVQLFAGYIERYPILFAVMLLYLVLAYKDWQQRRVSTTTVLALIAAISLHLGAAVLLPLQFALIVRKINTRPALVVGRIAGITIIAIGVIYYLTINQTSSMFIPIVATVNNPYSLLSSARWIDLLNVSLLSFPFIFLLPFLSEFWAVENRWFHILAVAPAIIFTILVDPKLGALRDWDLMSFPAMSVLIVTIATLAPGIIRLRRI